MDWEDKNGMIGGETIKRSLLTVSGSPTTENLVKVESDGGQKGRLAVVWTRSCYTLIFKITTYGAGSIQTE